MDLLLDSGADVDARAGGCVMGALYYGEARAAEHLGRRGATLDLVAAAGVGDADRVRDILGNEALLKATLHARPGTMGPGATRLAHYSRIPWPEVPDGQDLLGLALAYAALHGRMETLRLLLDAGADPDARDLEFNSTPLGWAMYLRRPKALEVLEEAEA
jgi:hypothetical protein